MITVVDYHMGNIGSIGNMIAKIGGSARISSDPAVLRAADKLILPGVGHFDRGMANLHELGLASVLTEQVVDKKVPVLGICLGMQLMGRSSEEGTAPGLGWVDAETKRFDTTDHPALKVPHMGWNVAKAVRDNALIDVEPPEPQRYYFVHTYVVQCRDPADMIATTHYTYDFCSAFAHGNIWGVQFHPEKSHAFGMELFRRFTAL